MVETKSPNRLRHATIEVRWRQNEPIEIEYNGMKLKYRKWVETVYEQPMIRTSKEMETGSWVSRKTTKPMKNHPWR